MEKPAPVFDRYPQYRNSETRYTERMIARGIPVVTDKTGESDKPVWRGDHSFNSDAAAFSLMHFIEPELAAEHPDWDFAKVKTEARERFKRRLAQDLSYEHKENHHEDTVVRWRPIETGAGKRELATEYGDGMITLRELWEHTKEYAMFVGNPIACNPEEERMQLSMQDEFIHGSATGFVSVLSHPDAVRYVQVWEKKSDGEITSKQVDLYASTGRDFSLAESERLMQNLAVFHKESPADDQGREAQYTHFFVESSTVNERNIRMIATALVMQQEYQSDAALPRPSMTVANTEHIFRDTSDAPVLLGRFLHNEISEKLRLLHVVNRHEEHKEKVAASTEKRLVRTGRTKQERKSEKQTNETRTHAPERAPVQRVETRLPPMKSAMAEWYISQTIVRYAAASPAGAHATLFWFAALERRDDVPANVLVVPPHEHHAPVRSSESVETQKLPKFWVALVYRWSRIFPAKQKEQVEKIALAMEATEPIQKSAKEKPSFSVRMKDSVGGWVRNARDRLLWLTNIRPGRPQNIRRTEQTSTGITELLLTTGETKEGQDSVISEVQIALFVWYILSGKRPSHAPQQTKMAALFNSLQKILSIQKEDRIDDQKEDPIWILLGIIRYLTLLRESGSVGSGTNGGGLRAKRKRPGSIKFTFAS